MGEREHQWLAVCVSSDRNFRALALLSCQCHIGVDVAVESVAGDGWRRSCTGLPVKKCVGEVESELGALGRSTTFARSVAVAFVEGHPSRWRDISREWMSVYARDKIRCIANVARL